MKDTERLRLLYQDSEAFKAGIEVGFKEALELVKEMREAQKTERKWSVVNFKTEEDMVSCEEAIRQMYKLESEVDELIKEMEE